MAISSWRSQDGLHNYDQHIVMANIGMPCTGRLTTIMVVVWLYLVWLHTVALWLHSYHRHHYALYSHGLYSHCLQSHDLHRTPDDYRGVYVAMERIDGERMNMTGTHT